MAFSVEQSGQVNRMTYPLRVPGISGFTEFFIIVVRIFSMRSLRSEIHPDLVFGSCRYMWVVQSMEE
jgi:hypothetical protein